jgi:hypothetical protein
MKSNARRFLDEMRERLREFALSLHPEKTRLIEFARFAAERLQRRGLGKPETFNFLGFTFICGKTRAGKFQIKRKTQADRMRAKLKMVQEEMRRRMHQPIPDQGKWLYYVVSGYFNYHAVPTNSRALVAFRTEIARRWRRVLTRRSERTKLRSRKYGSGRGALSNKRPYRDRRLLHLLTSGPGRLCCKTLGRIASAQY